MHRAAFEGVVEILAVRSGAVQEGRIFRVEGLRMPERGAGAAGIHAFFERQDVIAVARGDAKARHVQQKVLTSVLHLPGYSLQSTRPSSKHFGNRVLHAMYPPPLMCNDWPVI